MRPILAPGLKVAHRPWAMVSAARLSALRLPPSGFLSASRERSAVERAREKTSEEEQELLEFAPSCSAPNVSLESLARDPSSAAEALAEEGLLRLDGLLSAGDAAALRAHVDCILEKSIEAVARGEEQFSSLFGPVMSRSFRYDVLLRFDDHVLRVVRRLLHSVAPLLMQTVGDDCALCELSGLVSDPGAIAQPVHHDTQFDGSNPRVSLLVALQDVTAQMGPTLFLPRTNTPEWHLAYLERGEQLEDLLESTPHVRGLLGAGDAILYDTRLLHCGGANTSNSTAGLGEHGQSPLMDGSDVACSMEAGMRRTLLVLSAQVEDGLNRMGHTSMIAGYRAKYRIADFRSWVHDR